MLADEYQQLALRTAGEPPDGDAFVQARLTMCALGLTGESGEVADIIKKTYFHGHPIDREKLAKECGDVLWYLAVVANAIGYELSEIMALNIAKLEKRYPDGFSEEASINRVE